MEATSYDSSYDSATNWRIAGGSLVDSIAFESSSSSAAFDRDYLDENASASVDLPAKSPLLLLPPSPECDPCEITITFAQIHEVRQIYVRSTARVYEIYYRTRLQRSNEYLCTIRCGIAERDEEVLQASVTEAAALINSKELIKDPEEGRGKDNGNGGANEDDWFEVKASDASLLNKGKSLSGKPERRTQDLYEATAEISDVEPCISITLRLLSLQDKGCLFVDEVYVFADPADPTDSEKEASGTGNSAGSSFMAMFMPTLLQSSRARDASREQDKQTWDDSVSKTREIWKNSNDSAKIMNQIQQAAELSRTDDREVDSPAVVDATSKPAEPETPPLVSGGERKPSSCTHVEFGLQQLVTRVSLIENTLTRFEDQLLKPINSIDARLQQIEQKLEGLAKKANDFEKRLAGTRISVPNFPSDDTDSNSDVKSDEHTVESRNLRFPSCTRIVAPEFPSLDADTDSSYDNKSEKYDVEPTNLKGDDISVPNSSENIVDPQSVDHSLPGTDTQTGDDMEGDHSLGEPSEEKPKHVSINEALESALAGFLSSTSTKDIKYSQALVVTAPEFSNEEDGENDKKTLIDAHLDKSQVTSGCSAASETAVFIEDSENADSIPIHITSAENGPDVAVLTENGMVVGVTKTCDDNAGNDDTNIVIVDGNTGLDGEKTAETDSGHFIESTEKDAVKHETMKDPVVDEPRLSDVSSRSSGFATAARVKEEPKINDVLRSILGYQHASSPVDFETPVLDVKFNPEKTSNGRYFFEALLGDSPESTAESTTIIESIDDDNDQNLISVDGGALQGPPTDTLSSLDMYYCDTSFMHLNSEGDAPTDVERPSNEEDMPIATEGHSESSNNTC